MKIMIRCKHCGNQIYRDLSRIPFETEWAILCELCKWQIMIFKEPKETEQ
jgi:hypothetical protein